MVDSECMSFEVALVGSVCLWAEKVLSKADARNAISNLKKEVDVTVSSPIGQIPIQTSQIKVVC